MDEFLEMRTHQRKDWLIKLAVVIILSGCLVVFCCWVFPQMSLSPSVTKAFIPETLPPAQSDPMDRLENDLLSASFVVYGFSKDGEHKNIQCSATVFEKEGNIYRLITSAHCLVEDEQYDGIVRVLPYNIFIAHNSLDSLIFSARLVAIGFQGRYDDFAVLQAEIVDDTIPAIPLAKSDPVIGEEVVNVSFPSLVGRQLVRGITMIEQVEISSGEMKGDKVTVFDLTSGSGSSGSAIVSREQKAIVGVLTGGYSQEGQLLNETTVGLPVSKFRIFWEAVKADEYPWYQSSEESVGSGDFLY
ncbi:MAG: hypothetical protein COU29_03630 [Candidatus Magasanikbacteria bacterium CG10_big_fil_rev_8_21_14_0_10_36_32]|uniref:Peptidase S1 domain-containing protein n=1 Tax=Candidatus Magasanikbacteria bacterium CG10_big_fil_rev_8_21_14_0_10_36_32 TaxID=1974646 RepID=A0A2M6W5K5_9BACT|nr:MAG: hypothetical protein COU29_03630 [Candidatus Magasanikbacteria bacterium CG10_big_fil_rev_8_21_14_0_10_36_32]